MSVSRSIIVVDDVPELASLFKSFLLNEGHHAVSFTDSLLALEYYKATWDKHSLLITDLRMPGMCGVELAKIVRKSNSKLKFF
jgi:CheY-like chemotaxis protein